MFVSLLGSVLSSLLYFVLHVTNGSFPRALTAAEERKYLALYRQGDESARDKLIEHNLRLVAHVVKKYYSSGSDQDDLISIGTIGLIKAVSTFDDGKNIRLATYAARCIENEVLMYFRTLKKSAQDVSISDPIDTDKDGNTLTLIDVIAEDDTIIDDIDTRIKTRQLYGFLSKLPPRERRIIEMRYGVGAKRAMTQREVAKKLNISRSYISRLEKKALQTLYDMFENGQRKN